MRRKSTCCKSASCKSAAPYTDSKKSSSQFKLKRTWQEIAGKGKEKEQGQEGGTNGDVVDDEIESDIPTDRRVVELCERKERRREGRVERSNARRGRLLLFFAVTLY